MAALWSVGTRLGESILTAEDSKPPAQATPGGAPASEGQGAPGAEAGGEIRFEDVVGLMLDRLHPHVSLACSFQKEEAVLLDMLLALEPEARVFALDTHVLFPETYEVAKGASARTLMEMMARQFDKAVTPKLRQQIQARGLTLHQGLTLASIVEREAAIPAEQPVIASVYLNRLRRDMPLQADPTVQFAVANADLTQAAGFGYWKRELTRDDLRSTSPYNTYVQRGLPPGPICSPGLAALEAVANPAQTEYLFFVAKGDGGHVFAKTDTEHAANVERYRR